MSGGRAIGLAAALALVAAPADGVRAQAGGDPPAAGRDAGAAGPLVIPAIDAEAPVVRAVLSTTEVAIGEVFYLFVSVDHQPGVVVNLPAALPLGPAIEETARADRLVKNPAGGLTREFEIALMAFALGDLVVAPIPVTWASQGVTSTAPSNALKLTVIGTVAEGAALRDIAPPVGIVRRDLTLVWIGAGALGALVVVLVGWSVIRRRRRRRDRGVGTAAGEPLRSPHDEALARLAAVEGSGALDADDRKPVYLELSDIIRAYLGRRFGFPAPDLTTGEIRARLAELPDPGDTLGRIVDWLERGDLVKYARGTASEDEARQALYDARIFVERTREGAASAAPSARAVGGGGPS